MIRTFLFFIGWLLVTPASFSQQILGFALEGGKKKVQIPFELHNNLIVVPVVLNGMLPLKFVVDTGVQTAILTQKSFTDILNLPYSKKYTISGPGGIKLVEAYVTHNVTLELPGILGKGHALLVLGEDYLELRNYLGTDVHGIIGYELFSRFVVQVNYEKKVMTISSPREFKVRKKFSKLPMHVEDTKPFISTQVIMTNGDTIQAKLLVDSGASHGLLLEPTSDSRIQVPSNTVSTIIGRGIGGEITGRVGRIKSLALGSYELDNVIANFPDPNSYMDSLKFGKTSRNGTLGGEILSRFTVIFDFSKEELHLKRNSSFKKKFYYNLSGLTIRAKGAKLNTYEITEVRDRSAAQKADIRAGDLILSVNGVPTGSLDLNLVIGFFNTKPGKKIVVELSRDGIRLKKEFHLEQQI